MANEINNYIEDDWNDNSLANRSASEKGLFYQYDDGGTGDLLKGVYRPAWNEITSGITVSGGYLTFSSTVNAENEEVQTPSNLMYGSWLMEYSWINNGSNDAFQMDIIGTLSNAQRINFYHTTQSNDLVLRGSSTIISANGTAGTANHTIEITKNLYGNYEMIFDGTSKGTGTNTEATQSDYIKFNNNSDEEVKVSYFRAK